VLLPELSSHTLSELSFSTALIASNRVPKTKWLRISIVITKQISVGKCRFYMKWLKKSGFRLAISLLC
jgi:hypothetical protein